MRRPLLHACEALTWAHGPADPASMVSPHSDLIGAANHGLADAARERLAVVLPGIDLEQLSGAAMHDQAFCVRPGPNVVAQRLPSQEEIDQLLAFTDQNQPRFDPYLDGGRLPAFDFLNERRPNVGSPARVRVGRVAAKMAEGLTVQLNNLDDQHAGASALAYDFEAVFLAEVFVNAFLSANEAHGLGAHWDAPALLLVQAEGAKRWQLHHPTVPNAERGRHPENEMGDLAWDGTLRSGDALFVPPAWFHQATPGNGASLSFTIGISTPKLLDCYSFLRDVAYLDPVARGMTYHGEAADGLPGRVASSLSTATAAENVARYRWFQRASLSSRCHTRFALVRDALMNRSLDDHRFAMRSPGGAALCQRLPDDRTVVALSGLALDVADDALPVLAAMIPGGSWSVDELGAQTELDGFAVTEFVLALVAWDLVQLESVDRTLSDYTASDHTASDHTVSDHTAP